MPHTLLPGKPYPQGATWDGTGVNFSLYSEHAAGVELCLFDDIESAAFLDLSTVRQPLALGGAEGARRLCALLRGERVRPRRQELPIELMARGSSAEPRPSALWPQASGLGMTDEVPLAGHADDHALAEISDRRHEDRLRREP